jgi:hypothetical protein
MNMGFYKSSNVGQLRTDYGSLFMNFGAMDN